MKVTNEIIDKINTLEHKYRPYSISEEFHDKTRLRQRTNSKPSSDWPESWIKINFKGYPRLSRIPLLKYNNPGINKPLSQVLRGRISTRSYQRKLPLTKQQISTLLYWSSGIKTLPEDNKWDLTKRFYPSPGARYSLELYPIIFGRSEVSKGIYHYNVKLHALEILRQGDFSEDIIKAFEPSWIKNANMMIFVTAVFGRNQVKYGDRGYRLIFTENGHIGQNIYMVSTAIGLGCSALGGYPDDIINQLLDIDGVNESVINAIVVGFPKK